MNKIEISNTFEYTLTETTVKTLQLLQLFYLVANSAVIVQQQMQQKHKN